MECNKNVNLKIFLYKYRVDIFIWSFLYLNLVFSLNFCEILYILVLFENEIEKKKKILSVVMRNFIFFFKGYLLCICVYLIKK